MAVVDDPATLRTIGLFRDLADAELVQLNHLLHRRVVAARTNILLMEQPGDRVYFIYSGTLKVHVEQPTGTDFIIFIRGAGETVGEMSLIDNTNPSANVLALERAVLFWMDRATFQECRRTMPAINDGLIRLLSDRLRFTTQRLQWLSTQTVPGRVAQHLLAFARLHGEAPAGTPPGTGGNGPVAIPLRLTQSDLASFVGASRESVNKVMVDYKQRRYIAVDPNYHITIHNWAALAAQCE